MSIHRLDCREIIPLSREDWTWHASNQKALSQGNKAGNALAISTILDPYPFVDVMETMTPRYSEQPSILTTTVGSYPVPDWLAALPSEQALVDATRVIFDTQRQLGIDLPTDGELYRFDINHPDTNGMIDYFVGRLGGCLTRINQSQAAAYALKHEMRFRAKPAAVVTEALSEGSMNLHDDCARAAAVAGGKFKFTVTSPYMLSRTLLDEHYKDLETLTLAIADLLAASVELADKLPPD